MLLDLMLATWVLGLIEMTGLMTLAFGIAIGAGLGILYFSIHVSGYATPRHVVKSRNRSRGEIRRAGYSLSVGLIAFSITSWHSFAIGSALLVWMAPQFLSLRASQRQESSRAEALATWIEQLRDTIAVSGGLEQALIATAALAPPAIGPELRLMASRAAYKDVQTALRRFADDMDSATADFLVSALTIAMQHQARDLTALLSHLAETVQEQNRAASRVWVGRARTRSSIRIIVIAVISFVAGLVVLNRGYLNAYSSSEGQIVMSGIICVFGLAFWQLQRLAVSDRPHRFLNRGAAS